MSLSYWTLERLREQDSARLKRCIELDEQRAADLLVLANRMRHVLIERTESVEHVCMEHHVDERGY